MGNEIKGLVQKWRNGRRKWIVLSEKLGPIEVDAKQLNPVSGSNPGLLRSKKLVDLLIYYTRLAA
jgi:hypothetical protein